MNTKIYRVRRALVLALYRYAGAQDLATLLSSPDVLLESPGAELALDAWTSLLDAGLIIPLPGYGNQVGRLEPSFRQEMESGNGAPPYRAILYGPR